jgi:translation initiation factor 3 subunit F
LANTIRTQMELSNRLATAQLTLGGGDATGTSGEGNQRNQRGGKGGRQQRQERTAPEEARA